MDGRILHVIVFQALKLIFLIISDKLVWHQPDFDVSGVGTTGGRPHRYNFTHRTTAGRPYNNALT